MHELSLAQSIVATVTERMGDAAVVRVRLEIGTLSGVVVKSIRFCFDVVTAGTTLERAALEIDRVRGRARCRSCGTEFDTDDLLAGCACGSLDTDITGGDRLRIQEVEVTRDVRNVRV